MHGIRPGKGPLPSPQHLANGGNKTHQSSVSGSSDLDEAEEEEEDYDSEMEGGLVIDDASTTERQNSIERHNNSVPFKQNRFAFKYRNLCSVYFFQTQGIFDFRIEKNFHNTIFLLT